jgi:hypothetical protein
MVKIKQAASGLQKALKKGFRGFPVVTVAWYGPDNRRATKAVAGLVLAKDDPPAEMERWFLPDEDTQGDLRRDKAVEEAILAFARTHQARTVAGREGIFGCPHEEGVDYPMGARCPSCPWWADKDRFAVAGIAREP